MAGGRREEFNLGTSNKAVAAHKARAIYEHLRVQGWDATLALYKANQIREELTGVRSIGEFVGAIEETTARNRTTTEYIRRFRQIVGEIFGIEADNSKYDYRAGSREDRRRQIDAVPLEKLTSASVQAWRGAYLKPAAENPASQRAPRNPLNSTLRPAPSLFSSQRLALIQLPPR